ncbi:MAG TPA: amino acid adenylation domain-containing protein [Herpetosiphonaceae bacterium]
MIDQEIETIYELSPLQHGMLFHSAFAPESGVYVQQLSCTLRGDLDADAFIRAWQHIVDRHAILRTSFFWENLEKPLQVVYRSVDVPIEHDDWRDMSPEEQSARLDAYLAADRQRGFDLSSAPLMRLLLARVAADEHRLVWSHHHIVLDGWSLPLLLQEILVCYESFRRDRTPQLDPPRPYQDYIEWLQQQDPARSEQFWRQTLHGFGAPTPLGLDRRGDTSDPATHVQKLALSTATTAALQALARQHGLTLNTIVQGVWALLLSRYSRETDLVFGATVAGRPPELAGVETMVGLFINTLPVRAQVDPNALLIPWLQQLQARQVAQRRYEYSALVDVQGWSDVPRGMALFESIVVFENYPIDASVRNLGGDLKIEAVEFAEKTNFPLTIAVQPGAELSIELDYAISHFDDATIRRMLDHWLTLLTAIAADPNRRLYELPVMPEAERQLVVAEWNAPSVAAPEEIGLHQLIEAQAARTPDAIAVVFDEDCLSFRELNDRANQLAHHLQGLGVKPESLVGVYMERSVDLVVALLGIVKAGGAYVPLDPAYPAERLQFMIDDAQIAVLVTQEALAATLPGFGGTILSLDRAESETSTHWMQQPTTAPEARVQPDNLVYIIYTSGSTGTPKGVQTTHRALLNYIAAVRERYVMLPGDRVLQFASISFDASAEELFVPLANGAATVLRTDAMLDSPQTFAATCARWQLTAICVPTAFWNILVEASTRGQFQLPPAVKLIITGGEHAGLERVRQWQSRYGSQARLVNMYGPTEATIGVTGYVVPSPLPADLLDTPIGKPLSNVTAYILDPQMEPQPIGVAGELYIGGVQLARGYLGQPALTAEKFVPDPFSATPGARLYRTGDLVRFLPDGQIGFVGRIDDQVKVRGFRIELGEIESVLLRHADVRDAVVVVREDSGDKRLVAYVVGENQERAPSGQSKNLEPEKNKEQTNRETKEQENQKSTMTPLLLPQREKGLGDEGLLTNPGEGLIHSLRTFLAQHLPDYMVPSAFVLLDALPLTPNDKVDRQALPAPDNTQEREKTFVAPRTATEATLVELWSDVLGTTNIGVHDNFFALGGHSLLATQLVSRMREAFEIELPLREIFATPTIAQLAVRIETQRDDGHTPEDARPLAPVDRTRPLPLSFAQQRLWFLDQFEPNSSLYSIPTVLRITGRLDLTAFERSINTIISRHEILRTTFAGWSQDGASIAGGEPVQVIASPMPLEVPVVDLRHLPAEERETTARALAQQEMQQPFDLQTGPLLRVRLLQLDATEYMLLLNMHHIISDGWSVGVMVDELGQLYSAYTRGAEPSLPALPIQYADYAVWQRQWLQGDVQERQLRYWTDQLGSESPRGAVPLLDLPTDRPRPAAQTFAGTSLTFTLPQPLVDALTALSQAEQVTPFMTLLAAFNVLLYRYSGQDDIAIGTPIAGRTRREVEPLIGFFINTLVLRTDLSGAPAFRDLLQRVRQITLGAYEHQDIPFEMLVETLQPTRQLSHNPLFQVLFTLQNTPMQDLDLPDLRLRPVDLEATTTKTDLMLEIVPIGETLTGVVGYNTDLFDRDTIERMMTHYRTLLESIVANPDLPITHAPLLTEPEHRQMLIDWNRSEAEYPRDAAVHQLIEAQAARTPNTPAIVYEGASLTYAELNARANQLAHYLRAQGVGPDVLVGLMVERSLEMIVGMLAILKAGGAYLPLDPSYPAERLQYMLTHSRAPLLLTQDRLVEKLPEHLAQVFRLDADWERLATQPTTNPARTALPEHLAYVIYTSGSTGRPKGVMVKQQGLINLVYGLRAYFDDPQVQITGLITSISFDISVNQIFPTLIFGRTLHIISDPVKFNSRALLRYLDENQLHLLDAVPSYLQAVLNEVAPEQPANALRYLLIGGEKLEPRLAHAVYEQLGTAVEIINIYGLTEITDLNIVGPIRVQDLGKPITVGTPLQNNRIYILDAFDQPQPIGIAGEVCVSGESVSRGYLHRPELTAERFVPCPFEDGQIMVRTGDLGRWHDDGTVEILGRIDHQVKIRGFRIETAEIEHALAQHPQVGECVVVAREDAKGDKRLVAYVTEEPRSTEQTNKRTKEQTGTTPPLLLPQPSQKLGEVRGKGLRDEGLPSTLRSFLAQRLPDYMIPSAFVLLDALPLTPNGKIDRKALPAPDSAILDREHAFVAPRTSTEELLAGIWAEVLGLTRVSTRANFFALGGHSLLATRVIAQVRSAFQVELPLTSLFESPTVADMARQIETALHARQALTIPPIHPTGADRAPLSFFQHRFWMADQQDRGNPAFNMPMAVLLRGTLDLAALEHGLNVVVARQAALRTIFVGNPPVQVVQPARPTPLPVIDLRSLAQPEREQELQRLVSEDAEIRFDLQAGPLLRCRVVRLTDHEHVLLLTVHHIIADGWSMGVLMRELTTVYAAAVEQRTIALPPLPVQYADYAIWERAWLSGETVERLMGYWRRQLGSEDDPMSPVLALPTDYPRGETKTFAGAHLNLRLPAELSDQLHALSRREGTTLFMALLAAFNVLLWRVSGDSDIMVGTPSAGRVLAETDNLIGLFLNMLPLRTRIAPEQTFQELLRQVRETTLDAYTHQYLPMTLLVEGLNLRPDPRYNPLFQVSFNMLNIPDVQIELPGLTIEAVPQDDHGSKLDFTIYAQEMADTILFDLVYNTDLFTAARMEALLLQFQTLLQAIVADPNQQLAQLR